MVPLLVVAIAFFWAGVGIVGVALIVLILLLVAADSWSNRPVRKARPRYRDDY